MSASHAQPPFLFIPPPQEVLASPDASDKKPYTWFVVPIMVMVLLNIADALLTLFEIHNGLAVEGNPLMGAIIEFSPTLFILVKVFGVSACAYLLWRFRERPLAMVGGVGTALVYVAVCLWHIWGLTV